MSNLSILNFYSEHTAYAQLDLLDMPLQHDYRLSWNSPTGSESPGIRATPLPHALMVPAAPACRVGHHPDAINEHGELLEQRRHQRHVEMNGLTCIWRHGLMLLLYNNSTTGNLTRVERYTNNRQAILSVSWVSIYRLTSLVTKQSRYHVP
jgi:hypothetical protein